MLSRPIRSRIIHNNVIHSRTKQLPDVHFGGSTAFEPSLIIIFGSKVRIIKNLKSKRTIKSRTGGDLRAVVKFTQSTNTLTKQPINHDGFFVGFDNHLRHWLVYDPSKHAIRHCRHVIADEFGTTLSPQKLLRDKHILRNHPSNDLATDKELEELIQPVEIGLIDDPFDRKKCKTIKVTLPGSDTIDLGLIFEDDKAYGVPILVDIEPAAIYPALLHQKAAPPRSDQGSNAHYINRSMSSDEKISEGPADRSGICILPDR
jgi:hypothetical protein